MAKMMNQKEMQPKMCGYLIGSLMKAMFECKVVSGFLSCFQHPNGSQYTPNHHPKNTNLPSELRRSFTWQPCVVEFFPQIQNFLWLIRGLILLMAEILHHLACIKPCRKWDELTYQPVQDFSHQQ